MSLLRVFRDDIPSFLFTKKWERPTLRCYFAMMLKFEILNYISFSSILSSPPYPVISLSISLSIPFARSVSVSVSPHIQCFEFSIFNLQMILSVRICRISWMKWNEMNSMRIQNSIHWILQTTNMHSIEFYKMKNTWAFVMCNVNVIQMKENTSQSASQLICKFFRIQYHHTICYGINII